MCLAVPGQIVSIEEGVAEVDIQGVTTKASLALLDDVAVGDWVIVHTGFAIQKYDEHEALEALRLFKEIAGDPDSSNRPAE